MRSPWRTLASASLLIVVPAVAGAQNTPRKLLEIAPR